MSGPRKNPIREASTRTAHISCVVLLSLMTTAVTAETLTFDNPYNDPIYLEGDKSINAFCNGSSDAACFDRYLDLVTVRHLKNNFMFYEDSLKRFTYHTYTECLNKRPVETVEERHVKYSKHIKKYSRNVFAWGVGQYFYKNKQWPKANGARFETLDFERWLKETPREWKFLCNVLNK